MFNFLTLKERLILLVGPLVLVFIILFQGWQANSWRAEAIKEEQLKLQWANQYKALATTIQRFEESQKALHNKLDQLQTEHNKNNEELHHALEQNQDWSRHAVPDNIKRLLNQRKATH